MKPRVDVRPYIADADYVLQLSNDMETYCYTINEALGYGVPIVTTPLTVVKELPKYVSNEKVKNYLENANHVFDVTNSGLDAINNAVNKHNYDDVKNWINYEIKPRLKH